MLFLAGNSPRRRVNVNLPFNAHNEAVCIYIACVVMPNENKITFHDFLKECFLVMFEQKHAWGIRTLLNSNGFQFIVRVRSSYIESTII